MEEISQETFDDLLKKLEETNHEMERLQRWYLSITGKRWVPELYLTDPVNRAT